MEPLANFFDIKFEQLIVRYQSPLDRDWIHFGYKTESESHLTFGRPSVILLLGKNGSGKTRFLNGFQAFGEKKGVSSPAIILRFSVPPVEEHLGYLDAKENLTQSIEFQEMRASEKLWMYGVPDCDKKFLNLPLHDLIIRSIVKPILNFSFRNNFGFEFGEDVLKFFDFSVSEINAFKKRMDAHEFENSGHGAAIEILAAPRENLNFRDYFAEFFLALLTRTVVYFDIQLNDEPGPGSFFNGDEYLSNEDNRVSLVSGLRELFEGTSHVDVKSFDDNSYFSLVNNGVYSDGLRELQNTLSELRNHYDNISFPFDILRNQVSPSSNWLRVVESSLPHSLELFSVNNLTFQKRADSIADLEKIFSSFVKLEINFDAGPNYDVAVSGLEELTSKLEQVNRYLSEVEIGISKIELRKPYHSGGWYLQSNHHDFGPKVLVEDSTSKNWLELDSCSDGQLDVIRILVNLTCLRQYSKAEAKFLLIDEFDRHLHPIIAQQLLRLLDRYAKTFGNYVILSTHSFGSLEIHKHVHLFASRDLGGFQHLSTSQQEDSKLLAHQLGVPEIDTRKLKKLIVFVEGIHEEIIFTKLFSLNDGILSDVEIIRGDGLYGLTNFWRSQLQHENADVLIVYDKRNSELEEEWESIKSKNSGAKLVENLWKKYPRINQMLLELLRRDKRIPGDTELRTLAFMLKEILEPNENQIKSIRRLHLHGVEVPDIVDCLPISEFPDAKKFNSWVELREENQLHPEKLKKEFKINAASVAKAVKNSKDLIHPELQRLYNRILGIIDLPSDWPTK